MFVSCAVQAFFLFLLLVQSAYAEQARYVFLFIGDGMGVSQARAAEVYKAALKGEAGVEKLNFSAFPAQGMTSTHSSESPVTDSAAAGTAIACGVKTRNTGVGVDAGGKAVPSFAEMARDAGMKVGIVSSVSLDHATPAAFYAHQESRGSYHEIGLELAASDFDYFAGGAFIDPEGKKSSTQGKQANVMEAIVQAGYALVSDRAAFEALKPGARAVVVAPRLQDGQALPYAIDVREGDITLADLTAKGIEVLENPGGFFMMVESGKIDWACHANDAMAAIGDVLALEAAVAKAVEFADRHPAETLIVVTADHETGGMTLGVSGPGQFPHFGKLRHQKVSFEAFDKEFDAWRKANPGAPFEKAAWLIEERFGVRVSTGVGLTGMSKAAGGAASVGSKDDMRLTGSELEDLKAAYGRSMAGDIGAKGRGGLRYGGNERFSANLTRLLNRKAGLTWTSGSHTGAPVPTSAMGVHAGSFNGSYDNTALYTKIVEAMGLKAAR